MVKKTLTIISKLIIVLVTIILVALLVARKIFPLEKLKAMVVSKIETAIKRRVTVGYVWLNPFAGISIDDIVIFERTDSSQQLNDSTTFFSIDHLLLKYRLSRLLKKEISISKIIIDNPSINLVQKENLQWNFDDLLVTDSSAVTDTTVKEMVMPLSLDLNEFTINNLTAHLFLIQPEVKLTLNTGGITISVFDLFLPKNSADKMKYESRAALKIISNDKPWQLMADLPSEPGSIKMAAKLATAIDCRMLGLGDVQATGDLALENFSFLQSTEVYPISEKKTVPLSQLFSLSLNLSADFLTEKIDVKNLTLLLSGEKIFALIGEMTNWSTNPWINLQVEESDIRLDNLFNSILPLLPDSIKTEMELFRLAGFASLTGTKISGHPLSDSLEKALILDILFAIADFNVHYSDLATGLLQGKLRAQSRVIYDINGIQKIDLRNEVHFAKLEVAVDTTNYVFDNLSSRLTTTINKDFSPDSIRAVINIDSFFDAPLNFSFYFKAIDGLKRYQAETNLSAAHLSISQMTAAAAEGEADFALRCHSENLDNIEANLIISTDLIEIPAENNPYIIYPMDFKGKALLSTDTSFTDIKIKEIYAQLSDVAKLFGHGNFALTPVQKLTLLVDTMTVENEKVVELIPIQFLEGFEKLAVTGRSKMNSSLEILIPEVGDVVMDMRGKAIINAGCRLPEYYTSIGQIHGDIHFWTDGISAQADIKAVLDSFVISDIQDDPLRNITAQVKMRMPDFETIIFDSSTATISQLKANMVFTARIDSLSGLMRTKAIGDIFVDTQQDTIMVLNSFKLTGVLDQHATLYLEGDILTIDGKISSPGLSIGYEQLAQIDSITGTVFFSECYDIEKEIFVEQKIKPSVLADVGSFHYDLLRPYYQQSNDYFSTFRIKKINALDYHIENVNSDLIIANERIEIPRISMNIYDGNLAGLININMHDGDLKKIDWKIKANLSRMNSAKLLPGNKGKRKDADLNMILEMAGKGLDPTGDVEVGGYLYVTKIGSQFTDNVLRSLDPKGTDKSIQDTRKLLNWGYKPRLISFEIKHDNLYPSIHLIKGNFFAKLIPLNVSGGKIELARIPIKFFLSNLEMETR